MVVQSRVKMVGRLACLAASCHPEPIRCAQGRLREGSTQSVILSEAKDRPNLARPATHLIDQPI